MPGYLLHIGAQMQCFHQVGKATIAPGQTRVQVNGLFVATTLNQIAVAGCPFQIPFGVGTKPQPCVTVKWTMPAVRVTVNGLPALLQPAPGVGPGVCQSIEQIPQGAPTVAMQTRTVGA